MKGRGAIITSITIGDKTRLHYGAFDNSFMYAYYNETGRKGGRYEGTIVEMHSSRGYYWRLYDTAE